MFKFAMEHIHHKTADRVRSLERLWDISSFSGGLNEETGIYDILIKYPTNTPGYGLQNTTHMVRDVFKAVSNYQSAEQRVFYVLPLNVCLITNGEAHLSVTSRSFIDVNEISIKFRAKKVANLSDVPETLSKKEIGELEVSELLNLVTLRGWSVSKFISEFASLRRQTETIRREENRLRGSAPYVLSLYDMSGKQYTAGNGVIYSACGLPSFSEDDTIITFTTVNGDFFENNLGQTLCVRIDSNFTSNLEGKGSYAFIATVLERTSPPYSSSRVKMKVEYGGFVPSATNLEFDFLRFAEIGSTRHSRETQQDEEVLPAQEIVGAEPQASNSEYLDMLELIYSGMKKDFPETKLCDARAKLDTFINYIVNSK